MESSKSPSLFKKIKQISNAKKFRIIELTQRIPLDISSLSKEVKIAFNKCSNYCTQLEKNGLVEKQRKGRNTLIKSKVNLLSNSVNFN